MSKKIKIALTAVGAIVVVLGLVVLFNYNPTEVGFYPRCPSKLLTGYDCPGCGSLRGLHALMHGNIEAAWHFNPAIFFALALLAMLGIAGLARTGKSPRRDRLVNRLPAPLVNLSRRTARITDHPAFTLTILAAVIVWTILRNCEM